MSLKIHNIQCHTKYMILMRSSMRRWEYFLLNDINANTKNVLFTTAHQNKQIGMEVQSHLSVIMKAEVF